MEDVEKLLNQFKNALIGHVCETKLQNGLQHVSQKGGDHKELSGLIWGTHSKKISTNCWKLITSRLCTTEEHRPEARCRQLLTRWSTPHSLPSVWSQLIEMSSLQLKQKIIWQSVFLSPSVLDGELFTAPKTGRTLERDNSHMLWA